ncbi:chemotaxis protein CheW [Eubacteriaceae bacterium ES3]|nr:chemotaxis protein CheW [Eubacteriaceae bacterium ES3]
MAEEKSEFPWALFNLGKEIFAVSSEYVKSIFIMENLIKMPDTAYYIKGAVNLRGEIIPVIDTRKFYGMSTIEEEVDELKVLLAQRKQDHINWVNELENSVHEKRKFTLTTDPHACAFGKWYDSYKTEDLILQQLLKKFDGPHKRIHQLAHEVERLQVQGEYNKALNLIEKARNRELSQMIKLFNSLCKEYTESRRELTIVLQNEATGKQMGMTVDKVIGVEMVLDETEELSDKMPSLQNESLKLGRREKDKAPLFMIDEEYIINL